MDTFLFYFLSLLILFTAFKTISHPNPSYGALYLALTMILLAGLFFLMKAPFLAGLQLIIYAGAVIVLFVMVLMLFGFKEESVSFLKKPAWLWPVFLFGILSGLISLMAFSSLPKTTNPEIFSASSIAFQLFTKYVLLFELIGLFLLALAIGVVALSRLDKD